MVCHPWLIAAGRIPWEINKLGWFIIGMAVLIVGAAFTLVWRGNRPPKQNLIGRQLANSIKSGRADILISPDPKLDKQAAQEDKAVRNA